MGSDLFPFRQFSFWFLCQLTPSSVVHGKLFGKKWGFLTNALRTVAMLDRLHCTQDHEHQVVEGQSRGLLRSIQTQVCPKKLIQAEQHVMRSLRVFAAQSVKQTSRKRVQS